MSKCFNDSFRVELFGEMRLCGDKISKDLIGIVQNRMPITDEELKVFNKNISIIMKRLESISQKVNNEFQSDRMETF